VVKYYAKFPWEEFEWQKEVVFDHEHRNETLLHTYSSYKLLEPGYERLPGVYISEKFARAAIERAYTAENTPEPCIQLVWEDTRDWPPSYDVIAEWYPGRKEWKEIGRLKRLLNTLGGWLVICFFVWYLLYRLFWFHPEP
jgi:hypothetical protein